MMTVGISLKQLFQLCSGKYLKSEPSKFKAVNKVCLCFSCQDDLAGNGVWGLGDTSLMTSPPKEAQKPSQTFLVWLQEDEEGK